MRTASAWLPGTLLLVGAQLAAAAQGAAAEVVPDHAPPSDWPLFRGTPGLDGVAAGTLSPVLVERWSARAAKGIVSSPVVAAGRLVVGCDDGRIYAFDARTGDPLWTHDTGDVVEAPPLVHGGRVYVGSSSGEFHALDLATGELRWKQATEDKILGGANWIEVAGETRILVGSYDSNLYAFAASDGTLRWKYGTDNYVNGTPAVADGRVVFGGCDARLHVVDAELGTGLGEIDLGPDAHVAGSVALAGGRVYLGHYGNAFVCADLEAGALVWSPSSRSSPRPRSRATAWSSADATARCSACGARTASSCGSSRRAARSTARRWWWGTRWPSAPPTGASTCWR